MLIYKIRQTRKDYDYGGGLYTKSYATNNKCVKNVHVQGCLKSNINDSDKDSPEACRF